MNCPKCDAAIPANAKFCNECGNKIETSNVCNNCSAAVKLNARFCHKCGQQIAGRIKGGTHSGRQSWLNTVGTFLFIPIFAGIIVILFWVNRDPEPVNASSTSNSLQDAPSMAMMEQVHETLERLKQRIAADSTDVVAMDSLAMMYSIAGSHDKAHEYYEMQREHYEKQIETDPENSSAKVELAKSLYALQDTQEALSLLQEVLDREPTHAFGLFYLASIQEQLGHKQQAGDLWQKIVDAYPGTEMAQVAQQRIHELTHVDN